MSNPKQGEGKQQGAKKSWENGGRKSWNPSKYGNVGKLIELGKYYEVVQPKRTDFMAGDANDDKLL